MFPYIKEDAIINAFYPANVEQTTNFLALAVLDKTISDSILMSRNKEITFDIDPLATKLMAVYDVNELASITVKKLMDKGIEGLFATSNENIITVTFKYKKKEENDTEV